MSPYHWLCARKKKKKKKRRRRRRKKRKKRIANTIHVFLLILLLGLKHYILNESPNF